MFSYSNSTTYTFALANNGITKALDPLTYVGMFLNALAFILFYMFRTQRKFPCAALGWSSGINVLICWYTLAIIEPLVGEKECRATLYVEMFLTFILIGNNNVLAAILFVSIRLSKNMESSENKSYLIGCVVGVFGLALVMALIMGSMPFNLVGCSYKTPYLYIAVAVAFFCLAAQLLLITISLRHVRLIIERSRQTNFSKHDHRLYVLTVRVMLVFGCQIFGFFPIYLTEIVNIQQINTAVLLKLIGCILDALVLIFTNRPLLKKILPKLMHHSSDSSEELGHSSLSRSTPKATSSVL